MASPLALNRKAHFCSLGIGLSLLSSFSQCDCFRLGLCLQASSRWGGTPYLPLVHSLHPRDWLTTLRYIPLSHLESFGVGWRGPGMTLTHHLSCFCGSFWILIRSPIMSPSSLYIFLGGAAAGLCWDFVVVRGLLSSSGLRA